MNRRHLLKLLGVGSLMAPWPRSAVGLNGMPSPPAMVLTPPAAATTPAPSVLDLSNIGFKMFSLCIGLGPEAETLVAALQTDYRYDDCQYDDSSEACCSFNTAGLDSQFGTDPATLAAWSAAIPPHPVDFSVLVIDARDPQAREASRFWTERLAEVGYMRTALIIGDDHDNPDRAWRRELSTHFDVVDLCPQRPILCAAATRGLVEGLLFLNPSFLGHDASDFRAVFRTGTQARSAATVWSQAARRRAALHRLWHELPSTRIQGALGFLHSGVALSLQDFDAVTDALQERLPEEATCVVVPLLHVHWPARRQVLGLTLVGEWPEAEQRKFPG